MQQKYNIFLAFTHKICENTVLCIDSSCEILLFLDKCHHFSSSSSNPRQCLRITWRAAI